MEGKTVIAIAHRLSTIARDWTALVLDGGAYCRREGTHEVFLTKGRLYSESLEPAIRGSYGHRRGQDI